MSLPRQITPHSSSPSKSSLRKTSGTQNPTRTLLPSPHFEEPLPQRPLPDRNPEDEEDLEEEPVRSELHTFQPLFTLIEDSVTNEHYHPTVHYIFADDDTDIITQAAFQSLGSKNIEESDKTALEHGSEHGEDEGRLPLPDPNVREHYLVLDVQPTVGGSGYEVSSAQSLSSEWQVVRSNITTAPTLNAGAPDAEDGLMLKIEGRGNTPPDVENEKSRTDKDNETLEAMVERFQKRLDDIKRTMEAGGLVASGFSHEHLAE